MTNEDKKLIADYMGWEKGCDYHEPCNPLYSDSCEGCRYVTGVVNYDLNDASLCVQEMQKRGDWERFCANVFILFIDEEKSSYLFPKYIAWLFSADNFFSAFVEWRKGNEQG